MLNLKTVSGRLRKLFRGRGQTVPKKGDVEPSSRNLLVVDDEESICFSMSEYFTQHGFKVDTAREIEEAEGLIKETEYRVIIQDLRLGLTRQPDGIEIINFGPGSGAQGHAANESVPIAEMVEVIYADQPKDVHPLAARSVLAHRERRHRPTDDGQHDHHDPVPDAHRTH
mgnify:CR=1 FL=1